MLTHTQASKSQKNGLTRIHDLLSRERSTNELVATEHSFCGYDGWRK
jgi:hypothetical protein